MNESGVFLQQNQSESDDITNQQSFPDDEHGEPKEGVANGLVSCAQRLQYANHVSTFEDDDEQTADHGEASHANHQRQDNPYVQVEQVEPRKDLRIVLLNGSR